MLMLDVGDGAQSKLPADLVAQRLSDRFKQLWQQPRAYRRTGWRLRDQLRGRWDTKQTQSYSYGSESIRSRTGSVQTTAVHEHTVENRTDYTIA